MKINNEKIKKLYEKETKKLVLDFPIERYREYINIIKRTPAYSQILTTIPDEFSKLEKVYFIYNKLGVLLYENNNLVYNHIENLEMYYDVIKEGGIGNCRQMSELFVTMLKCKGLINSFYLTRKPVGVKELDLRHIDAIIQIDGKLYMIDLIRDTVNMRAKIRNKKFGYKESKEKRKDELLKYINSNQYIEKAIREKMITFVNEEQFYELLNFVEEFEIKNNVDLGSDLFKNKIPKIEYASQIEEQIGKVEEIPIKSCENEISIEYLDNKIGNKNTFYNLEYPFDFEIEKYHYLEDILEKELVPRLLDNELTFKWASKNNALINESINNKLELTLDIIIDFISKVSPNMDLELLLKYIKEIISKLYLKGDISEREYKKWAQKNIKLYKVISENDLEAERKELPLETFIIVRKFNSEDKKEKYICYKFSETEGNLIKKSYKEIINESKKRKLKIKFKFSGNCQDSSDELEI